MADQPPGTSAPHAPPTPPPPDAAHTRTGTTYAAVGAGLLVLVVLIIFFAQNLGEASVHFLGWRWRMPTGVVVLASAVAGGLIVMCVSLARIVQLRRAARRTRKAMEAR